VPATWLTSGWIDVAMVTGWMALVIAIGVRAWRASETGPAEPETAPRPGALHRVVGWGVVIAALPRLLRRSRRG
jgi:hypothetical protein